MATTAQFGPFEIDPRTRIVSRAGEPLPLGQRAVALLEALAGRVGDVVTKSELMEAAWPGTVVEEGNLTVQIAALRKALGTQPDGGDWIATVPRIGYRFVAAAPATGTPAQPKPLPAGKTSIAVLPFSNLGTDTEQEFFADGLAEEIITTLSKFSGLLVIARNSSFAYKGTAVDIRKVAEELDVRYVLAGSVRRSGNRVRMAVQLADAETGGHLWADRYDRELTDVFAVQDEVAQRIVQALELTLKPTETSSRSASSTTNVEALACLARARAMQNGPTQNLEVFRRCVEVIREALGHDPDYGDAWSALASAYALDYANQWTGDPDGSLREARTYVDRALQLAPDHANVHGAAGVIALLEGKMDIVEREAEIALALNPNYGLGYGMRGNLLMAAGQPLAAIPFLERALRLEPMAHQNQMHHLGVAYLLARKYETAVALFRERIVLVPNTDMTRGYLISALGHLGNIDEARQVHRELMAINPKYSQIERIKRNFPYKDPAVPEHFLEGWRKAGLTP